MRLNREVARAPATSIDGRMDSFKSAGSRRWQTTQTSNRSNMAKMSLSLSLSMLQRPRSPDGAHALACQQRHGKVKKAVKACDRCFFMKHRARWTRRFPWLMESPETQGWGLGCRVCQDQKRANPDTPWIRCTKGQNGKLQAVELTRHAECQNHVKLVVPGDSCEGAVEEVEPKAPDVPTAAQIRLTVEVARNTFGPQNAEFERRAELAGRADGSNYPAAFNRRHVRPRLLRCLSEVLLVPQFIMIAVFGRRFCRQSCSRYTNDRNLLDKKKVVSIGCAEAGWFASSHQ